MAGQPLCTKAWNMLLLTSIPRMDYMKATLRCCAHVSRSVHRSTAAISRIPELILPVPVCTLDRGMMISNFPSHLAREDVR